MSTEEGSPWPLPRTTAGLDTDMKCLRGLGSMEASKVTALDGLRELVHGIPAWRRQLSPFRVPKIMS